MIRRHALLTAMLWSALATAQWDVPAGIVLDGAAPADRQVLGSGLPGTPSAGVSAEADRTNAPAFATATGTDALTLALTPALSAYAPGLRVGFVPTAVNLGDASLNVDGLGAVPLRKDVNVPLDSADLQPGIPVQVVYDGAVFQVVNQLYPGCPFGFSPVNRDVCIANTPNDTLNWYAASVRCANRGARLCSMQEWIQGCLRFPWFVGTVVNYEWVDSAGNNTNMAKNMGWTDTSTEGDCRNGNRQVTSAKFRSRCCYDR